MNTPPHDLLRWEKGSERELLSTRILDVRSVHYRHPARDSERDFVVIDAPDWVNVIALTPDRRLVLVRQFRFGIDGFSLEIPGGVIEKGENPVAAGLRELAEETGFVGKSPRSLGSVHPNPAIQNNRCHLVLVEDAELRQATALDVDEDIAVVTAPVDDVLNWARTGAITHSLVLCGLFHFEAWWRARV
jgi:ADP-ribose pyrophosphatase